MSIRKYEGQELIVGQYVNFENIILYGFAARPFEILQVKGRSIVVHDVRRLPSGEVECGHSQLKHMRTIKFVSDSLGESELVYNKSRELMENQFALKSKFDKEMSAMRAQAISELACV